MSSSSKRAKSVWIWQAILAPYPKDARVRYRAPISGWYFLEYGTILRELRVRYWLPISGKYFLGGFKHIGGIFSACDIASRYWTYIAKMVSDNVWYMGYTCAEVTSGGRETSTRRARIHWTRPSLVRMDIPSKSLSSSIDFGIYALFSPCELCKT